MKLLTELVDIICWMTLCMSGWLVMAAINPPPPAPHKQQPGNIFRKCKMYHSHTLPDSFMLCVVRVLAYVQAVLLFESNQQ